MKIKPRSGSQPHGAVSTDGSCDVIWLPVVDAFRTLAVRPPPAIRVVSDKFSPSHLRDLN